MKIVISQLNYTIGDFKNNTRKIIDSINEAKLNGADLIVFAELAIGGVAAFDLYNDSTYREKCMQLLEEIKCACSEIACIIGGIEGQRTSLMNSAFFIYECKIQKIIRKRKLSVFEEFSESRYFISIDGSQLVKFKNKGILISIGEDADDIPEGIKGIDFIINLCSIPFSPSSYFRSVLRVRALTARLRAPVFVVNQIGGHGDYIFDGRSFALDKNGEFVGEMSAFSEDLMYFQSREKEIISEDPLKNSLDISEIELIHRALILGIRDFFFKQGFEKAVLGLSGGLDSALVAALACEALGAENVLAILLPSVYSTDHSLKDAMDLVVKTGCDHEIIPIKETVLAFETSLESLFKGKSIDLTEENLQARARGVILMAISNKLGYIVLNTSNKSECAVGYGTLYGDMVGSLSVLGDVYKTRAFELANYINRDREIIPFHTISKPPSAELRPDQKDSDSLPDYGILDEILYLLIESDLSRDQIIENGYNEEIVDKITKLVKKSEFKRFQAPPILRVSDKAFGRGRVLPIVSKF